MLPNFQLHTDLKKITSLEIAFETDSILKFFERLFKLSAEMS